MADILLHYGIPGMRWGHKKGPDNSSTDHQRAKSLRGKNINEMTNEELRVLAGRMQLEKQYKEALRTDIHPGKKFVQEILTSAGKQVASKLVADGMTKAAEAIIKRVVKKRAS